MTDTKENNNATANNNNAKAETKTRQRSKSHKVDLKNMFKSKHNKDNKKQDGNQEAKTDVEDEKKEETKPEEKKDETKAEGGDNNNDTCNLEGDAKKPLDDCEGCKDEVLHETDKAAGKPIVGFSEKVGASFRKWFHLAGAPE